MLMNKNGISPLIATVLIIGLVVVIAVLVNSFIFDITEEEIGRVEEESKVLSSLLNYDVSCKNAHDRSYVRLSSSSDSEIDFTVQFDEEVVSDNILGGFGIGTVVGAKSDYVKVIPSVIVNGEKKVLAAQSIEDSCSDDGRNYALEFDGIDDYVELPSTITIGQSSGGAIGFWGKTHIISGGLSVLGDSNYYEGYIKMFPDANRFEFESVIAGNPLVSLTYNLVYGSDTWQYYLFNFEEGIAFLYVNGVLESSNPYTGDFDITFIGDGYQDTGPEYFNGVLDEIRIWNQPLTVGYEISELYRNNKAPTTGLVSYWNFDDNNAKDSVGNNDGTIQGGAVFVPAN